MLTLVSELFSRVETEGLKCCHWKSNTTLEEALEGKGDLDLLVPNIRREEFEALVMKLGFKETRRQSWESQADIVHYYGLDASSNKFVHLHIYYKLISGGSLLKKYHFTCEDRLFESTSKLHNVNIPQPELELVLLVIRKILEHAYWPEYFLLKREYGGMLEELRDLSEKSDSAKIRDIIAKAFPEISWDEFSKYQEVLLGGAPRERRKLSRQLKNKLSHLMIISERRGFFQVYYRFLRKIFQKFILKRKSQTLVSGGAVIAFVGPDASGKSTIASQISGWLKENFWVCNFHVGKPKASLLTVVPRLTLPLIRKLFPQSRSSYIENEAPASEREMKKSLLYFIRRLMVAYDRLRAARKAVKLAGKGSIVICDRYPSSSVGAMDGPQLECFVKNLGNNSIRKFIARKEKEIYGQISSPDVLIQLITSYETAVERNKGRKDKTADPDEYLRRRHQQKINPIDASKHYSKLETLGTLSESFSIAQERIWAAL